MLALGGDINALYALLASIVLAAVIFALIVRRLPSSLLWHKLVLRDASTEDRGYVSAVAHAELVGRLGTAVNGRRSCIIAAILKRRLTAVRILSRLPMRSGSPESGSRSFPNSGARSPKRWRAERRR